MRFLKLLGIFAIIKLAHATTVNILDQNVMPISSIIEHVCRYNSQVSKQISNVSTVAQIADHLSSIPTDHKLYPCKKLYMDSINDLTRLLSISNHNVCSQEKISAIQRFHRGYILKGSLRIGKAPKILATFFIQYVSSIAQVCASETSGFLEALNSGPETDAGQADKLLAELTGKMGVSSSSNLHYSDMFLLWSIFDLLPLHNQHKIEKYLFQGEKRVVMALKNPQPFFKMQELCRTNASPLYSYSLLSTIKLIDMGYYPLNSDILDHLNSNKKQARRFYELTKLCEALRPVLVVKQFPETDSQAVLLSQQEVDELGLGEIHHQEAEVTGETCKRCSMTNVDTLPSVTRNEAMLIAKLVKNDIRGRKGAMSRLLKMFFKNAKHNLSATLKKLFGEAAPADIGNVNENRLDIYQISEEDDLENKLVRSKRGLKMFLLTVGLDILQILVLVLLIVWCLVVLFISWPLFILYEIFSFFTGFESYALREFLSTGGLSLVKEKTNWD